MMGKRNRNKGFGLIEILVTLGVLAVGILGVASLHSVITRQTQDNKARIEAISIAEARLEEMRNYTSTIADAAAFNLFYPVTTGAAANVVTVNGINAQFTRSENISSVAGGRRVIVNVAWTAPDGDDENVSLSTQLVFMSPRSVADAAQSTAPAMVDAPTGRARLGEGALPADAVTTPNGDGTSLYTDGSEDLMLVSNDQIVLTLAQACQTEDGNCIDFVKIKGRIWIDKAGTSVKPGEVFVFASDAAFCARHYTVGATTTPVTNSTTTTVSTASGNYQYFDYTCYLGGGWHGNVGVLLAGGLTQRDKVCVGDPSAANSWQKPVLAARRAYRGMLYRHDAGQADGRQKIEGTNLIRYYSQGIADETVLPLPGQAGHDFVITQMPPSETADTSCVSRGVMVRADATVDGVSGALFAGVPTDFVCLNNGLLDTYNAAEFGHDNTCPYDPTDPPIDRHELSGTLRISGANTTTNLNIVNAMGIVTSDGPGNCSIGGFTYSGSSYTAGFSCSVFDWGNGWNGYIELVYVNVGCSTSRLTFTNLTSGSANNNFNTCSITGGPPVTDPDPDPDPDPGTDPDPDPDPDPGEVSYVLFSGTLTSMQGNHTLTSITMSDGGTCALAGDRKSYSCSTAGFYGSWSGSLTFVSSAGVMCTGPGAGNTGGSAIFTYSNLSPGNRTLNINVRNNQPGSCQ